MGGASGSAACRQVSHLLASCWVLHQSNGDSPELGSGLSCLASAEMGGIGAEVVSWGLGLGGWWFTWEASHSPVPPTDEVCVYAIQTMESVGVLWEGWSWRE